MSNIRLISILHVIYLFNFNLHVKNFLKCLILHDKNYNVLTKFLKSFVYLTKSENPILIINY